MQSSPIEDYLESLAHRLEQLQPEFSPDPEEALALDELVQKDFERCAAHELEALAAANQQVAAIDHQITLIQNLNWFKRWSQKTTLASLQRERGELEESIHRTRNCLAVSERKYHANPVGFARIHQRFEELGLQRARRVEFEQLRRLTAGVQHQILQTQLMYGRNNVALAVPASAPVLNGAQDIGNVLRFLEQLAVTLPGTLERGAIDLAGTHDAQEILASLRTPAPSSTAQNLEFDLASARTLSGLLTEAASGGLRTGSELMRTAVQPCQFRQLEAWLMFWTCQALNSPGALGTILAPLSLSERVDAWCDAWREQSAAWSPGTLRRFAAGYEAVPCLHYRLAGHGPRAASHDLLIIHNVAAGDRSYCSVAGIHFESPAKGPQEAVGPPQPRIASSVANLRAKSVNRWRGLAASFPEPGGQLNEPGCRSFSPCSAAIGIGDESLAGALAACLTATPGNAFESIRDAFNWLGDTAGLPLPRNLIVMSVGRGAEVLEQATELVAQLAPGSYVQARKDAPPNVNCWMHPAATIDPA